MLWQTRTRLFDLSRRGVIMGVLNATPDSFSDGGQFLDPALAIAHARQMADEGAQIIDVGGESTRPGATPVEEAEELRRVLPVIEALADDPRFVVSIDTMKPRVAAEAVRRGAAIVNDVSGLREPAMRAVVAETGAGAIVMHMQGLPATMQIAPHYEDVVREIGESFRQTIDSSLRSGIDMVRLALDPGIGFGKTAAHNLTVLRRLGELTDMARPIVLGVSRKSFLAPRMEDRSWPTVALTSFGRTHGAHVFRVHEVRPNLEALRMTEAILHA